LRPKAETHEYDRASGTNCAIMKTMSRAYILWRSLHIITNEVIFRPEENAGNI